MCLKKVGGRTDLGCDKLHKGIKRTDEGNFGKCLKTGISV